MPANDNNGHFSVCVLSSQLCQHRQALQIFPQRLRWSSPKCNAFSAENFLRKNSALPPEQHAFFYDILPTSISADGLSFTLLYSGTDTGALLAMNGTFTPGGGGTFPGSTPTGGTTGGDTGTSGTSMFGTSGSGHSIQETPSPAAAPITVAALASSRRQ